MSPGMAPHSTGSRTDSCRVCSASDVSRLRYECSVSVGIFGVYVGGADFEGGSLTADLSHGHKTGFVALSDLRARSVNTLRRIWEL